MIFDSSTETLELIPAERLEEAAGAFVRQSLEAGFQKHLTKPVNLQRLEAAIRQVMGEGR